MVEVKGGKRMVRELSVGQVARRAGVAVSTLHFYERSGLISSHRTAGNQRRYGAEVLRRVAIIRAAQAVGVSLEEIGRRLAGLPDGRVPNIRDWDKLAQEWRSGLDQRIAALTALRDGLTSCIGCGCLSIDKCVLFNPQDQLASEGPGARRLPRMMPNGGDAP